MGTMHGGLKALLRWTLTGLLAFQASWTWAQEATCHFIPSRATWTITVTRGTLSDSTLEVNRGDKVVWFVLDQPVTIAFQEGRTSVFLACASSTSFEPSEDGTYLSAVILPGGQVSLCFIEPGVYEYVVSPWRGADIRTGTIVVK